MDETTKYRQLTVINRISEMPRVEAFLEELGDEWELPMPLIMSLNLVLEEALTNTINYGFDDQEEHSIKIDFELDSNELHITIIDDGREYDPTLKTDPDITLSVEDRPIGGLGIFLIKKIMDKVEYKRENDKNYLLLAKKTGIWN